MEEHTYQQPQWVCKHFSELSLKELYQIIWLRNQVFVVEQNCVFQDADGKDEFCHHLLGWYNGTLVAYCRLINQNITYNDFLSIGRVVVHPNYRRFGFGKQLMNQAISLCFQQYGEKPIKIGAQLYLKAYYESFGFQQVGSVYDEDGIDHIHMILHTT